MALRQICPEPNTNTFMNSRKSKHVSSLAQLASHFESAHSDLIEKRVLQKRKDSKYLVDLDKLEMLFDGFFSHYRVLEENQLKVQRYQTRYFDEESLRCFENDKSNVTPRHKVRIRKYLDRDLSFFEIKSRNETQTKKRRVLLECAEEDKQHYEHDKEGTSDCGIGENEESLILKYTDLDPGKLQCEVKTSFHRLTLLGVKRNERITIDTNLIFERRGEQLRWEQFAIVEIKHPIGRVSPFSKSLALAGYKVDGFSKYKTAIESFLDHQSQDYAAS